MDLREEELTGGHAIARHVGRSESSRQVELASKDVHGVASDYIEARPIGSFDSLESANRYVSDAIASNPAKVAAVVAGSPKQYILKRYSAPTGDEVVRVFRPFGVATVRRPTFSVAVVLAHVPGPRGYRIITAFPMNGDPDVDGY